MRRARLLPATCPLGTTSRSPARGRCSSRNATACSAPCLRRSLSGWTSGGSGAEARLRLAALLLRGVRVGLLLPRRYVPAGGQHRVVAGLTEHLVQLATAHAEVASVVEREDHRVAHDALQRSEILRVAADAHDAHAVVDRGDGGLRA